MKHWPQIGVVAFRLAAAILGGYAVAYTLTAAVSLGFPGRRDDAVQAGAMLAFPVEVAATLWLLVDRRLLRPVLCLAAVMAVCMPDLVGGRP